MDAVLESDTDRAAGMLAALGHPQRLAVIRRLAAAGPGGLAAGTLADAVGLAPNALSFHLTRLAQAGLVRARREGRFMRYSAELATLSALAAHLTETCCQNTETGCTPACSSATSSRSTT